LAVDASRSAIAAALLRTVTPPKRPVVLGFLRGLSRDELECVAEFEGACTLESCTAHSVSRYRMLPEFFDSASGERWCNEEDRAHKTFVLLTWTEFLYGRASTPAKQTARVIS